MKQRRRRFKGQPHSSGCDFFYFFFFFVIFVLKKTKKSVFIMTADVIVAGPLESD